MDISVVVPMHNESEGMEEFFSRVVPVLDSLTGKWEIICVDDGSRDDTHRRLLDYHERDRRIKTISFSRNFGKEAATTAGLDFAGGKVMIPIDADLQDPPELIPAMFEKWKEGYMVVLATRSSRDEDSWFKRETATGFYKIMSRMSEIEIPRNTGDFRLMDRQVVEVLKLLPEKTRFMKGLFAWLGFPTATVYFERPSRFAGKTNWNYMKLWSFALDGIFSFSSVPLKVWTYIGVFFSVLSLFYGMYVTVKTMIFGIDVPGYASIMTAVLFLGGIQLISLGIMGEYIGRIYKETKNRPIYVVHRKTGFN